MNGKVDYQDILDDPSLLNKLLGHIVITDVSKEKNDVKTAYWVNTYNILVIRAVLEKYPISSVDEVPGFYTRKWFKIGQENLSLNDIESVKIKELNKDPKIYFLLCKGTMGNPPLLNEACFPQTLTSMIRERTEKVLNDTVFVKAEPNGTTQLASFFRDKKNEFTLLSGNLQIFLNKYRIIQVGNDSLMAFFDVNRALNDREIQQPIREEMIGAKSDTVLHNNVLLVNKNNDTSSVGLIRGTLSSKKNNASLQNFFTLSNQFFNNNVYHGRVDYYAILKSPKKLTKLISMIIQHDLTGKRGDTRKAFWINAYNLLVIKSVIDHYPLISVNEIPGFFNEKRFTINGEQLSLNDIEREKLMESFKDPRLHFVLCKGMLGSPPLQSEAYEPEILSSQIIDRTVSVLYDTSFVNITKEGYVLLADWFNDYKTDFHNSNTELGIFINKYHPGAVKNDSLINFTKSSALLNEEKSNEIPESVSSISGLSDTEKENVFTSEADDGILSSLVLLPRKKLELRFNDFLQTFHETYGKHANRRVSKLRYTTNNMNLQVMYGIGRKTTLGVSLSLRASLLTSESENALQVLRYKNDSNSVFYLRSINPVIRFNIAEGFFHVSMQNTFFIPLNRINSITYNGAKFRELNPYMLQSQLYIYKYLSEYVKIMLEAGVSFKFDDQFHTFSFVPKTPLSTVFSLPINRSLRIFGLFQGVPAGNIPGYFDSYYFREGTGLTFTTFKSEFSLYYSYNFIGRNANVSNSMVINLRIGL